MSSTESEEFESADEEYQESPKKVIRPKTSGETKKVEKQEHGKLLAEKVAKNDNIDSNLSNTEEKSENNSETPSKNAKVKVQQSKPQLNIEDRVKLYSTKEESVDPDGWDVDDWESQDQNNPTENKNEPKKTDNAEEGWSDFDDDWGDGSPAETPKKPAENINTVFPILDEMSPDKQSEKSEGILHNLSKLVMKPEPVSSYDAFPVLNDLSPTKKPVGVFSNKEIEEDFKRNIIEDNKNKPQPPTTSAATSSWGWKPWGGVVSTILSTATEGVTSLTSHVSQGLSNVIESGMGVPDPEELARINKEQEKVKGKEGDGDMKSDEVNPNSRQEETLLPSLGNIVSGVTHIGNKVITGGLDTLEGIGKKTMTILQENDPLLLNKRKMLGLEGDKPVLSQVLREAKEKSEEIERNLKQMHRNSYKKQLHFETLFDHYYGLVHLEALEMLSKQSSIKLQSLLEPLTGKALVELQETLNEVKELCELGDLENDENDGLYTVDELFEKLKTAVEDLGVQTDFKDILKCWGDNTDWLNENQNAEPQEVYEKGLRCLAETCALAIHRYHKIAEMLLIKDHHSTANEADSLVQLTTTLCWHLNGIANRFGGKLNSFVQSEETSSLITSIFVEVYNSNSYIQNAFQLFIPILQIGAA